MSIFKRKKANPNYPNEQAGRDVVIPGETPTTIVHYPGEDRCRIVATEYWSMKMIGELATNFPVVNVLREDDTVIEATFPAEWLFLKTHPVEKPPFFEQPEVSDDKDR